MLHRSSCCVCMHACVRAQRVELTDRMPWHSHGHVVLARTHSHSFGWRNRKIMIIKLTSELPLRRRKECGCKFGPSAWTGTTLKTLVSNCWRVWIVLSWSRSWWVSRKVYFSDIKCFLFSSAIVVSRGNKKNKRPLDMTKRQKTKKITIKPRWRYMVLA